MASHAIGLKMNGDEVRMQPSTRVGSGPTALGSRVAKRAAARMRPLAGPFDCRATAGHAPKRWTTEPKERARNWCDYEELRDDRASTTRQAARIPSPSATVSRHHEAPTLAAAFSNLRDAAESVPEGDPRQESHRRSGARRNPKRRPGRGANSVAKSRGCGHSFACGQKGGAS